MQQVSGWMQPNAAMHQQPFIIAQPQWHDNWVPGVASKAAGPPPTLPPEPAQPPPAQPEPQPSPEPQPAHTEGPPQPAKADKLPQPPQPAPAQAEEPGNQKAEEPQPAQPHPPAQDEKPDLPEQKAPWCKTAADWEQITATWADKPSGSGVNEATKAEPAEADDSMGAEHWCGNWWWQKGTSEWTAEEWKQEKGETQTTTTEKLPAETVDPPSHSSDAGGLLLAIEMEKTFGYILPTTVFFTRVYLFSALVLGWTASYSELCPGLTFGMSLIPPSGLVAAEHVATAAMCPKRAK